MKQITRIFLEGESLTLRSFLTLFTMGVGGGGVLCAHSRFFSLLWEHQGFWESVVFREFVTVIKVFELKN